MENKKQNYAFIDAQNLYLGMKNIGWKLDYKKFRVYLKEKHNVLIAFLFMGYLPDNKELYKSLERQGYVLRFKPVLNDGREKIKGDVDADMVLNIMKHRDDYNQAVIVTSDGDFDTTVSYLLGQNKLKAVYSPVVEHTSALLKIAAKGKMLYIKDIKNKVKRKNKIPSIQK